MKKILYCVRHGQSVDEQNGWFAGSTDTSLTPRGVEEVLHIGTRFHVTPINVIYASIHQRALQSAMLLQRYLHCDIQALQELAEWNREGILSGLSYEQASRLYPEQLRNLQYFRAHALYGEPYDEFMQRVLSAFDQILQSPYRHIMIVTHGNVIGLWLREIHRITPHTLSLAHPDHIVELRLNTKGKMQSCQSAFVKC